MPSSLSASLEERAPGYYISSTMIGILNGEGAVAVWTACVEQASNRLL